MASDHHGCVPPIDSSDSSAPKMAAKIPITRPKAPPLISENPGGELDDADDDRDPAPGVEAREHVLRVVEEMSVADRGDAVDDVQRARDQQQNRNEQRPTQTSHVRFLSLAGRRLRRSLDFV